MEARRAVLVVDDEPEVRAVAVGMMAILGVPVYEASSGDDALKVLAAHPEIALLFSDVRMPEMSGIELAERAHEMRPDLRVVLTSGHIGEGAAALKEEFLAKPYRLAGLAAMILPPKESRSEEDACHC